MAVDIGELRGIITLQDQFSGPMEKVAGALGISSQSFGAISQAAGLAAAGLASATAAIVYLGERGSAVDDVRTAFNGFAQEAGATADVMLGSLRTATDGTISDFDLMKMSSNALGAGLVKTKDDMGTLAAGARLLADRTGGDTKDAFDKLTAAMEGGRTKTLASMGVFVDAEKAVKDYATTTGRSVSDLSAQEKAQAVSQATLAALRAELVRSGEVQADFSDRIAQGRTAIQNFTDDLGESIAKSPVVAAGMDAMATALQGAFGGESQDTVKMLMGHVNSFAVFLVDVARVAVRAAEAITVGFSLAKVVFNSVLEALATGVSKAADMMADLAEKGADLPVVGEGFKDLAGGIRSVADTADALAVGFADLKDKAADSAIAQNDGFAAVRGALDTVRQAMVDAGSSAEDLTQKTKTYGTEAETVATRSAEASKKISDAFKQAQDEVALIGKTGIERRLIELDQAHTAEIEKIKGMKDLTAQEYADLVTLADERYRAEVDLATVSSEAIETRTLELHNAIALAGATGLEARLLQIEQQRLAEIAGLDAIALKNTEVYDELEALINTKYANMTALAQGHFGSVEAAAAAAGFKTRVEMQTSADDAKRLFDEMKGSGKFTYTELERAHKAWKDAENKLNESSAQTAKQQFELIASAAKTLMSAVFGNSKLAAIAQSLVDTAAAVVKALASAPPPLNFGLAAAVGAAGLVQTNRIRSTNASFAEGTPGTRFEYFGRGTAATLHGHEAVVNRRQADSLAGMIGFELSARDGQTAAAIGRLERLMEDQQRTLPLMLRDAAMLAAA